MSLDEERALADARNVTTIANCVVEMTGPDRRHAAAGLITLAQVLVDGDELGKAVLAQVLRKTADTLEPLRVVDLRLLN